MSFKILIVDDEPNIVIPLQFLMEQNGYNVMVSSTGDDAMEMISSFMPDLVLLDIMLPGLDGYEVCQMMHENSDLRHIKIIFLTAMGRDADMAKGLAIGADSYITKPFSNADVVETVRILLEGKE